MTTFGKLTRLKVRKEHDDFMKDPAFQIILETELDTQQLFEELIERATEFYEFGSVVEKEDFISQFISSRKHKAMADDRIKNHCKHELILRFFASSFYDASIEEIELGCQWELDISALHDWGEIDLLYGTNLVQQAREKFSDDPVWDEVESSSSIMLLSDYPESLIADCRKQLEYLYTVEELSTFRSFKEFFDDVDILNSHEEDWKENVREYRRVSSRVWSQWRDAGIVN